MPVKLTLAFSSGLPGAEMGASLSNRFIAHAAMYLVRLSGRVRIVALASLLIASASPGNAAGFTIFSRSARCWRVLAGLLIFSWAAVSQAEVVRFRMTGTVDVYDPTFVLPAGVVTGAAFTAFLTYDTSVPDSLPGDPRRGRYDIDRSESAFDFSLRVGELDLGADPADGFVRIEVIDNASVLPGLSPPSDALFIADLQLAGGPDLPDPYRLERLQFQWDDLNQDSWNGDDLPVSFNPAGVRMAQVSASRGDEQPPLGRPYHITAFVTDVVAVPEPSAGALVAMAGILAAHLRRRRSGGNFALVGSTGADCFFIVEQAWGHSGFPFFSPSWFVAFGESDLRRARAARGGWHWRTKLGRHGRVASGHAVRGLKFNRVRTLQYHRGCAEPVAMIRFEAVFFGTSQWRDASGALPVHRNRVKRLVAFPPCFLAGLVAFGESDLRRGRPVLG